jgi:hypothetical protein
MPENPAASAVGEKLIYNIIISKNIKIKMLQGIIILNLK